MPKVTGYCLYSSFDSNVSDVRIITEQQNPCITYSMSFTHCNWVELTLELLIKKPLSDAYIFLLMKPCVL